MTNHAHNDVAGGSVGIDLTPMLDVVFILLIFFIITASFVHEASMTLERPVSSPASPSAEQRIIVVNLHSDNQIFLEGRRIDYRSLRAYFERLRVVYPDSALVINAHNNAVTRAVVQVSDAARQAGIYRITLASNESLQF